MEDHVEKDPFDDGHRCIGAGAEEIGQDVQQLVLGEGARLIGAPALHLHQIGFDHVPILYFQFNCYFRLLFLQLNSIAIQFDYCQLFLIIEKK